MRVHGAEIIDRDLGWREILKRAREMREAHVNVGLLAADKGGEAHDEGSGLTVAEIALIHEFGAGNVPARPFMKMTFDRTREEMHDLTRTLADGVVHGKMDVPRALDILGAKFAAELKKTLTSGAGVPPPLAPATLTERRTGTGNRDPKPLVDTGHLLNSITWVKKIGEK